MSIYPRKYYVQEGNNGKIVIFIWEVEGYSRRGIRFISNFLQKKIDAKKKTEFGNVLESMIVLEIDGFEVSVYQDDMNGIDVMVLSEESENSEQSTEVMNKIIQAFNKSWLFSNVH